MSKRMLFAGVVLAYLSQVGHAADLILHGGRVATLDPKLPRAEAIAVRAGRIVSVGTNKAVLKHRTANTKMIQLRGRRVIPGLIEGHGHFVSLGTALQILDLRYVQSWKELVERVGEAAKTTPPGRWIIGRGWHQGKWRKKPAKNVQGYPVHTQLSRVTPAHPVLLTHASGHMLLANELAMKMAQVNAQTQPPRGGEILKLDSGEPTGVFRENAMGLLRQARSKRLRRQTPQQRLAELHKAIQLAGQECMKNGITSFQDAGSSFATIDVFRKLATEKRLPVRMWVMVSESNQALQARMKQYEMVGFANHFLTVKAIKRMFDGALGTHGAWLFEPYQDLPRSTGLNTLSMKALKQTAQIAHRNSWQLCVHAIGDRANHEVLNVYEQEFGRRPDFKDWRWRIEHAQHLRPADIPRFAQLGVIASMQAIHCTSDAPFVIKRLGLRRARTGAYVWQSLLKAKAVVINGTDAPVEPLDPFACFYASVTRKLTNGVTFFHEQRMTRKQALRSYTLSAAFAAREEKLKGSIQVGKLADLVVLSQDLMSVAEKELARTRVDITIIDGKIVFRKTR